MISFIASTRTPILQLAQLSQHLESTSSPHAILPAIAETIAQTLKLPYVEIEAQPLYDGNGRSPAFDCVWHPAQRRHHPAPAFDLL